MLINLFEGDCCSTGFGIDNSLLLQVKLNIALWMLIMTRTYLCKSLITIEVIDIFQKHFQTCINPNEEESSASGDNAMNFEDYDNLNVDNDYITSE